MTQSKLDTTSLRLSPATRLDIKSMSETGAFEGYGSIFGNADSYGDRVVKGAFSASLAAHKAKGTAPVMLWQHNADWPIGVWSEIREDDRGLYVKGQLNTETEKGREARSLLTQGAISGLSIGFTAPAGARQRLEDGTTELRTVDLWEVSLVTFPANDQATVLSAKSINTQADFERLLKHAGFANRAAKKLAAGGWSGLNPETQVAELVAEMKAVAAILRGTDNGKF
jgi:hypothetical protein